ncbi:hypothetical protein NLI96_g7727 [Meripilus lineatus]|uniref:DUF6533 domain-containing protein n=1 Tax=Meripilus lineatus TaxID=2056292 RepID=A0AAD5V399_9APHY|nr:hypothetical protein NLI96_g7727 [Physisporinus lineatus]
MDDLVASYFTEQGVRFCRAALLALFVYEMLITIDQEIEAIWKRRFTVPSLIYLTMRMGTLGASLGTCRVEVYLLRSLLLAVEFTVSISEDALEILGICAYDIALGDTVDMMNALLWVGKRCSPPKWITYRGYKHSVHLALNTVATITNVMIPDLSPGPVIATTFSTILYTRFILNLRTVENVEVITEISSLKFASIVGNIGAPLELSAGALGERSYVSPRRQIENPLSLGILDILPGNNERGHGESEGMPGIPPEPAQRVEEFA